jgi:hypothetical protein
VRQRFPALTHDCADALWVVDESQLMHDVGRYFQDRDASLALLADKPLGRGIGEQRATNHQRLDGGVVLDGLQNEAKPLGIVEAGLVADLSASQVMDTLDKGMLVLGDGGAVLRKKVRSMLTWRRGKS